MNKFICQYCNKECKNSNSYKNHEQRCSNNANRNYKNGMLGKKGSNHFTYAKEHGLPKPIHSAKGKPGRLLTDDQKERLSLIAKDRGFGGYQPNAGRSKKFKVIDSFGNSVTLQSTYEFKCFQVLTEMNVCWIRPKALKYDDRNYFADFYLVDYGIYLDPKNAYKAKLDREKIKKVIEQNSVSLFVLLEHELTKENIARIVKR